MSNRILIRYNDIIINNIFYDSIHLPSIRCSDEIGKFPPER